MNGVIDRLAVRGYDLDYGKVYGYLSGKIAETSRIYSIKQAQYSYATSTYYSTLNRRNTFNSSILALENMKTAVIDFTTYGYTLEQLGYDSTGLLAKGQYYKFPQIIAEYFGYVGIGVLDSLADMGIGFSELSNQIITNNFFDLINFAPYTYLRNYKSNYLSTVLGVGDEPYFQDDSLIEGIFPGLANYGNALSPQYSYKERGYLAGKSVVDTVNIFLLADGLAGLAKNGLSKMGVNFSDDIVNVTSKKYLTNKPNTGWKAGNPINNYTSKGNVPKWNTVRQRFWKNEALLNSNNYNTSNLSRIKNGLAPIVDGAPLELHHTPIPQRDGGLFRFGVVTPEEHALVDPFRNLSE